MERKPAQTLLGIVSEYPEHQKRSSAMQAESACRSYSTKSAPHAVARQRKSQNAGFAQSATNVSLPKVTGSSRNSFSRKSVPLDKLRNTGKPSASTKRRARRVPAYVGNITFPESAKGRKKAVEIRCSMSEKCLTPGQIVRFPEKKISPTKHETQQPRQLFPMVPRDRRELAACIKLAAAGATLWVGVPAIMSLLHLGGIW